MPADGNAAEKRDTLPAPSPGEAWRALTRTRHGRHERIALLCGADEHHRGTTNCDLDGHPYQECGEFGWCALHQHTPLVAEAAVKLAELVADEELGKVGELLECAMTYAELDTSRLSSVGREVIRGILVEAARML